MMGAHVSSNPVFVMRGNATYSSSDDGPGTGGLFVYAPEFAPYRAVGQILVEYAEQGVSVLIVDRKDDDSRSVLSIVAKMLGLGNADELIRTPLTVPLYVRTESEDVTAALDRVSVVYDSTSNEPDPHACDMGDVVGVLYVMTYPNEGARTFSIERFCELKVESNGRYVREH
jgi:hypothetical protein